MKKINQSAQAPEISGVMSGNIWSINTPPDAEGEASAAVRISFECWEHLDKTRKTKISEMFGEFIRGVEDLF